MKNIDIQQIESYLRGKMPPEEQRVFEADLAADPDLRQRYEELRQMADGIMQVARADLRQRVETLRDKVKMEESGKPPKPTPTNWGKLAILLFIGMFLGLGLGWLLFYRQPLQGDKHPNRNGLVPVALSPYETIATIHIPSPQPEKNIQITVLHDPDLDTAGTPVRRYALDRGGVGICVYARREDYFWRQPLALLQSGQQFFLKIGVEKFRLLDDGEEHPFPEKPEKD